MEQIPQDALQVSQSPRARVCTFFSLNRLLNAQVLDTACRHRRGYDPAWLALGRAFMSYATSRPIGAGLCLYLGYQMSVRPTQSGLAVVLDRAAGAFYKDGPVMHLVMESVSGITPARGLNPQQWSKAARLLKGLKVARQTRKGVMIKKALGITPTGADEAMFEISPRDAPRDAPPERVISVAAYFEETGNPLQYPKMPCVVLNKPNQPKMWIPFEKCTVVKGQRLARLYAPRAHCPRPAGALLILSRSRAAAGAGARRRSIRCYDQGDGAAPGPALARD